MSADLLGDVGNAREFTNRRLPGPVHEPTVVGEFAPEARFCRNYTRFRRRHAGLDIAALARHLPLVSSPGFHRRNANAGP